MLPTTLPVVGTTAINYGSCGFSGTIPTEFGLLTKSTVLSLNDNTLTGAIPTQLGQLTQMMVGCSFSRNPLSSTIPTELGKLSQMSSTFQLSTIWLKSAIPTQLGQLSQMSSSFDLRGNSLSSTIPTQLGKLDQMSSNFMFTWNYLRGGIPSQLGQLTQMSSGFYLYENYLSLAIPTELGKLSQMSHNFYLSLNHLSSSIPTQLGQLYQMISKFNLRTNSLSSTIPTELGKMSEMALIFLLYSNKISSSIPTQLGQMSEMTSSFYLDSNKISSSIPTQLGQMSKMASSFSLSANSISSSIPTQLGQMNTSLELQSNSLCGYLPTELANLPVGSDIQEITEDNFIGLPCSLLHDGRSNDDVGSMGNGLTKTSWLPLAAVLLGLVLIMIVVCHSMRALWKTFGINMSADGTAYTSNTDPLLENGSVNLEIGPMQKADDTLRGPNSDMHSMSNRPCQKIVSAWRSSDKQLMVLDHKLRVVLWSKGMTVVANGTTPEFGACVKALPFASLHEQDSTVAVLESIMNDPDSEIALDPIDALHTAFHSTVNIPFHLVTSPSNSTMPRRALLGTSAIKMKPFMTGLPAGPDDPPSGTCHLLVLGHDQLDPALVSLCTNSREDASDSISELTEETTFIKDSTLTEETTSTNDSELTEATTSIGDSGTLRS